MKQAHVISPPPKVPLLYGPSLPPSPSFMYSWFIELLFLLNIQKLVLAYFGLKEHTLKPKLIIVYKVQKF